MQAAISIGEVDEEVNVKDSDYFLNTYLFDYLPPMYH